MESLAQDSVQGTTGTLSRRPRPQRVLSLPRPLLPLPSQQQARPLLSQKASTNKLFKPLVDTPLSTTKMRNANLPKIGTPRTSTARYHPSQLSGSSTKRPALNGSKIGIPKKSDSIVLDDKEKNPFVAPMVGSRTRSTDKKKAVDSIVTSTTTVARTTKSLLPPVKSNKIVPIDPIKNKNRDENHKVTLGKDIPIENGDQKVKEKVGQMMEKFKTFTFFLDGGGGGLEPAKLAKLSNGVKELGGTVDPFLRKGATHFITAQDVDGMAKAGPVPKKSLLPPTAKSATDNLAVAKRLGLKIWNVARLEKVLLVLSHYGSKAGQSPGTTGSRKLKDALRDEKLYGPSTNRDPEKQRSNFQSFKDLYFLIEEPSGHYKPVIVKDISSKVHTSVTSYPEIQWQNAIGHCVFIPQQSSKKGHGDQSQEQEEDSEEDTKDDGKENMALPVGTRRQATVDAALLDDTLSSDGAREPEAHEWRLRLQELSKQPDFRLNPPLSGDTRFDLDNLPSDEEELEQFKAYAAQKVRMYEKLRSAVIPNSTASGLVSGSVAALMPKRDMTRDPRLANLGQRVLSLSEKGKATKSHPQTASNGSSAASKKKRGARPVPGKSFYRRPGYCENCAVKYDEFCTHVRSRQHKYWAKKSQNFRDLDYLLAKIIRASAPSPEEIPLEDDEIGVILDGKLLHDNLETDNEEEVMSTYAESMEIQLEAEPGKACEDFGAVQQDEDALQAKEVDIIVRTQAIEEPEPEIEHVHEPEQAEELDLGNGEDQNDNTECPVIEEVIHTSIVALEAQVLSAKKDCGVEDLSNEETLLQDEAVDSRQESKKGVAPDDEIEILVPREIETWTDEKVANGEMQKAQIPCHLPSIHLRYDYGNTSCGPSALYKENDGCVSQVPTSNKKRKQSVVFDIPAVTTRRQRQAEEEELLLAIRLSEASALQNPTSTKKRRIADAATTPASRKSHRSRKSTRAPTPLSVTTTSSRLKAKKVLIRSSKHENGRSKRSSTQHSVNTSSSATHAKDHSETQSKKVGAQLKESETVGRRALRERSTVVNYKKML